MTGPEAGVDAFRWWIVSIEWDIWEVAVGQLTMPVEYVEAVDHHDVPVPVRALD